MADITIPGNLTADPELRFTQGGQSVLNFTLAENHSKKDQSGQWVDDGTTFYRVAMWGKRAETLADHLSKGASVLVTGRFRGGEFTSKTGELVKTYEVPRPQRSDRYAGDPGYAQQGHPQGQPSYSPGQQAQGYGQQDPWAGSQPQDDRPPF
jgi:single-strand DNA-binding protein